MRTPRGALVALDVEVHGGKRECRARQPVRDEFPLGLRRLQKLAPRRHRGEEVRHLDARPHRRAHLARAERHALFAQLEGDLNTRNLLDHRANLAMDLYQASQATNPCDSYLATLRMIEASRDPYFLRSLVAAGVPTSDGEVRENEAALLEARARVLAALQSNPKIQEPGTTKRPAWRPSSPAPSDQSVPDDPLSAQGSVTDKLDG